VIPLNAFLSLWSFPSAVPLTPHPPFFSLYEHESAALAMQEQQAEDADDVEQLLQREMDAVSVNGGATPLSSLEADIQGTRAALLAALADDNQDDDSDAEWWENVLIYRKHDNDYFYVLDCIPVLKFYCVMLLDELGAEWWPLQRWELALLREMAECSPVQKSRWTPCIRGGSTFPE
jgi:hypothetical protein